MKVSWKHLAVKTIVWITAEIILNLFGLDSLADYSEYVFDPQGTIQVAPIVFIYPQTI